MADLYIVLALAVDQAMNRERVLRDRFNGFELPDDLFHTFYRLPRHAVMYLCDSLRPDLSIKRTRFQGSLNVEEKVLCALRFFASGGFQSAVGHNYSHGVGQMTVSRCIHQVCDGIIHHFSNKICFPDNQVQTFTTKTGFHNLCGLPNILGAIDCTHILIKSPYKDHECYINRKGKHTINVQLVCDHNLRITNIVAKWPGSTHDSFIWANSSMRNIMMTVGARSNGYLLGDSGYPLEPWLMTPFEDPDNEAESHFNRRHIRGRNTIERCNGVLKSRFRCLDMSGGNLQYTPDKVCRIVTACAILHNICLDFNAAIPDEYRPTIADNIMETANIMEGQGTLRARGVLTRAQLAAIP